MKDKTMIHVVEEPSGKMLAKRLQEHTPLVGDEIRIRDGFYVLVKRRIWCWDEDFDNRCNLGVKVIKVDE